MKRTVCDSEYEGLFAEFHDVLHLNQTADVALFRELAREVGSPVLELGCGSGRILAPLVEDGHEVVGVDSSKDMLRLCGKRVGDRAMLHHEDMRRLRLGGRFRLDSGLLGSLFIHTRSDFVRRDLVNPGGFMEPGITKKMEPFALIVGKIGWGFEFGGARMQSGIRLFVPVAPGGEYLFRYHEFPGGETHLGVRWGGDELQRMLTAYVEGTF